MKKILSILIILVSLVPFSASAKEAIFPEIIIQVIQDTCPVMKLTPNPKINTIIDGKLYYFCCSGCISTFRANPEKYGHVASTKKQAQNTRLLRVTNPTGICPVTQNRASLKFFKIVGDKITFYANKAGLN